MQGVPERRGKPGVQPAGLKILLVEDNIADARLIGEMLHESGIGSFLLDTANRLSDAVTRIRNAPFDIVLLDLGLPDSQGLETLHAFLESAAEIPVIVLTGLADEAISVQAVEGGAQDYLVKGNIDGPLLSRAIRYAISRKRSEQTLRELERQLVQSQKLEAVGRLAGGIAHDFNNLLTVTLGYCDLALSRIGGKHPLRSDLEEIRKASDRCATLTRQLLAFSRKQLLIPKVINLGDIVAEMDKMLRSFIGEDIDLVSVGGKGLWNVKADPGQIGQVIVNLAVNSRDAMPRGGKLTIETSNVVLDESYTREHAYVSPGSYVLLAVSDTGCGMDESTVSRAFEPFFTTKKIGTGLGLSTVYGIVKQSGGHIDVYSEPGIGTTVKMYFPRVKEPVTEISGESVPPFEELRGGETILVVEDEELVRQIVREILVHYGYTVLEARSGNEAMDLCSRHKGTIRLMLTDVVMLGMSGVELSKQLAVLQPEVKVLFMSGYTADTIADQGVLDPGIAFIHKPFTMASLAHKVREVLDGT